ncbi:MAG: UDP-N-acetylmuramate--L-alanine ligase [bacterium]|nr:UDP-N-acetylmuramate--L-alanine ligase [bacterium]
MFYRLKNLHFIGIGGIGMSGIAEVLLNQGFRVTGSDLVDSDILSNLRQLGAEISIGHNAANVQGSDVVVYSSAVKSSNVELQEARRLNIPAIARAEMLSELMRMKYGIAIAGTHGKTTTTSMIAAVMTEAELDPTFIVGGRVKSLATNAKLGSGEFLVAEADEFDRSFLKLTPAIAVITTLESEHLDTYGSFDELRKAFLQFARQVPFYGSVVLCIDEPTVAALIPELQRPVITYGLDAKAKIRAFDPVFSQTNSRFQVEVNGERRGEVQLHQPGLHNIKNALAAIGVAEELKIDFRKVVSGLNKFRGVERRFEIKGEANGVMVVDDYAHHPTEIQATLRAARGGWKRRIVAVFQPHLYTRTRDFVELFGQSFKDADVVVITGVYGAREEPIPGVSAELIVEATLRAGHKDVHYFPEKETLAAKVLEIIQPGDIVVCLGAGDIWKVSKEISSKLSEGSAK